MENILLNFVIIIGIIIVSSIINEKKFHFSHDIAILIGSFIFSVIFLMCQKLGFINFNESIIGTLKEVKLDNFLLDGVLCFIMFASASKIHLNKFIKNVKPIASLSIITTTISSLLYAGIFYSLNLLLNLNINFWICLLIGALLAPTDPAPAMGVLNKSGLSKSVSTIIEGESLFNDGIAVAIIIFAKEILSMGIAENILLIILKEIVGAIIVGLVISYILFRLTKHTNEPLVHILISLFDVSLSYVICEHFGFSGVIASVICGMYFAYQNQKIARWKEVVDSKDLYNDFWNIVENVLNSVLFVLVGLSVLSLEISMRTFILIPIAIVLNLICRYISTYVSCKIIKEKNIPSKYNLKEFVKLATWCGLKGGLSLALALTTKDVLSKSEYNLVINVVLITILFTTIVQGMTVGKVFKIVENSSENRIYEKHLKKYN